MNLLTGASLLALAKSIYYLNKPDEDWYWPVEISQLNSISRCLISPCKSLLGCNVFNVFLMTSGVNVMCMAVGVTLVA